MFKTISALAVATVCCGSACATPLPVDNGLMSAVPGIGPSRVETITFCLNESGVDKYQDLITDSQFDTFTHCMKTNT